MANETLEAFKQRMALTLTQDIQWGDMDAFRHVNNTIYFRYFENIRIRYFDHTGVNELMKQSQIGPILGSTDCRFMAPLTYPDTITIGTCITDRGDKRFTMSYEIFSHQQQKIVASGSGVIVYYDYNNNTSCQIPQQIIEAIDK
ncbi:thioesterase family protein [Allohahella marinimesophila]|uniref:Thioesterase family protein n=1 Tax=Allohahella marinimesophila TaxID=1054972 RepID=A0ABP7PXW7_9GAMM